MACWSCRSGVPIPHYNLRRSTWLAWRSDCVTCRRNVDVLPCARSLSNSTSGLQVLFLASPGFSCMTLLYGPSNEGSLSAEHCMSRIQALDGDARVHPVTHSYCACARALWTATSRGSLQPPPRNFCASAYIEIALTPPRPYASVATMALVALGVLGHRAAPAWRAGFSRARHDDSVLIETQRNLRAGRPWLVLALVVARRRYRYRPSRRSRSEVC
jgi:hypothetical protein